ncbi:MAG: HAD-IA family hydrolase [Acidimicrobiia bacterium]|nr:HAD-IA family hydrolase [Acidimicrobiia bacterium]
MTASQVIFCDVGGVVLTNGWDTAARKQVVAEFQLDFEEFEERHQFVVHRFETGRLDLGGYLAQTVGSRDPDFPVSEFGEAMLSVSRPLDGGLELATELATLDMPVVTLNNESRALHNHRVVHFGLDDLFDAFFTSGYLGVKKPDDAIYRMALDVMAADPGRSVFIDDRRINLEAAAAHGMRTIHHTSPEETRAALASLGLAI